MPGSKLIRLACIIEPSILGSKNSVETLAALAIAINGIRAEKSS